MSALFELDPVVLSGTTGNDRRYVQFWLELKYLGTMRWVCVAAAEVREGEGPAMTITNDCPSGWRSRAYKAFESIADGELHPATHTASWGYGKPIFTEITP